MGMPGTPASVSFTRTLLGKDDAGAAVGDPEGSAVQNVDGSKVVSAISSTRLNAIRQQ